MEPPKRDFSKFKEPSNNRATAFMAMVATLVLFACFFLVSNATGISKTSSALQARVSEATSQAFNSAVAAMPELPKLEKKMNILVMGVDWNGEEAERYQGTRSDTMMVVKLDPEAEKVSIVSIPRDSRVVIPGHGVNKINSAHAFGGSSLAIKTVEENFNIPIDHYAIVDTQGLTNLFKLLGPFKVVVEKEMHYHDQTAKLNIDLKPGEQVLEAEELVGYLRFRHDALADIGRMERQQWFLRQALDKLKDPKILLKAPQLIQIGYESINTDLSIDQIASIYSFGKDLTTKDLITATLPGHSEDVEGVNYLVLSDRGTGAIFSKLGFTMKSKKRELARNIEDVDKQKIRISIKCARPMTEYAEFLSAVLKEKGWRVKYTLRGEMEECQHAQLNLNHTRVSSAALSILKSDLPMVENWPVVIKYGAILGSDVILVLPNSGGMSRWYSATEKVNLEDIPESDSQLTAKTGLEL